jgi:FdrA protein
VASATLEDAARDAVALARGKRPGKAPAPAKLAAGARAKAHRFRKDQQLVHGLYSGGTLCQEAAIILSDEGVKHAVVDLGDDEFTVGRPHPMIDFRLRNDRIVAAAKDPATAVILLDVVLGYGAHPDPAGALGPALAAASKVAAKSRRGLAIVASVCGTETDPQNVTNQEKALAKAGVLLAPSNAQAARLAAALAGAGPGARQKG